MTADQNSIKLRVSEISKSFGGVKAVNDVSFQIKSGEILALIGPNGAGKTTLFNCVNGVYEPEHGSILFEDQELVGLKPPLVAALGIARTFQNLALFSNLNVVDSLMLGRHLKMKTGFLMGALWLGPAIKEERDNRARCAEFIDLLELGEYARTPVGLLPYGVQKQIELGRALAAEPKLLLLDEPVSGLNSAETAKMGEILKRVRTELNLTMLIVEHDMSLVGEVSDRVIALSFGEIIGEGTPQEIPNNPKVVEAYLGASQ